MHGYGAADAWYFAALLKPGGLREMTLDSASETTTVVAAQRTHTAILE